MAAMKSDPGTFARGFPRRAAFEENGNARNNKRQPDGGNILTGHAANEVSNYPLFRNAAASFRA